MTYKLVGNRRECQKLYNNILCTRSVGKSHAKIFNIIDLQVCLNVSKNGATFMTFVWSDAPVVEPPLSGPGLSITSIIQTPWSSINALECFLHRGWGSQQLGSVVIID